MRAKQSYPNALFLIGVLLIATPVALACIWSLYTDHSVRFNSFRSGRGFYRLPPLPIMYDSKTGKEIITNQAGETGYSEAEWEYKKDTKIPDPLTPSPSEVWEQARVAVQQENLGKAQSLLQKYLAMTALPTIEEDHEQQRRRNAAYDMLDAMTALQQGSKAKVIAAYLETRYAFDNLTPPEAEELINQVPIDKNLHDNWLYLRAAIAYQATRLDTALITFHELVTKYPHSEKIEAALYMMAKIHLELSQSYENTGCGITDTDEWGRAIDPAKIEPTEKCQDSSWQLAVKEFQEVMRKYPNGRYFNDARGWLAYLYRRGGERAHALAEYYRLLGHPTDWTARLEAKKSLQMIGHEYDDAVLDQVEDLIASDAHAALAYAYHRIYNHAVDYTYQEGSGWNHYDENERWQKKQEEEKRVAEAHETGHYELSRVARFATAMMKRHRQARVSGAFILRVAQAQFELQNYAEALSLARQALALGLQDDLRAQALWIKGSAEHQRKDFSAARATFNQLIAAYPKANLTEGARRLLAMTAEDQGDFETALEQYLVLNYQYDIAYFVDVLLPTEQLSKFVASHKQVAQYNQLVYALGIRYMRDKRWNDARIALQQVQTNARPRSEDWQLAENESRRSVDKEPDWDWKEKPYIKTSWVMQDLKTIDALERLEQAVAAAQEDEAKAEAMYQLASYQFDANALLFYNPVAWRGQRYWLLSDLDGTDDLRLPNESQRIFNYSQSHETLARAIPIYLEIVNRFPQTKAAQDALYTTAVAHQHLSNLNPYWRSIYGQGLFAGSQLVTYADVKRIYPNYQLPRGTNGWEASTRTVNGGPGWEPPPPKPKPLPQLTKTQKLKRWWRRIISPIQTSIQQRVETAQERYTAYLWRCLYATLAALGFVSCWYVTLIATHYWNQRQKQDIAQLSQDFSTAISTSLDPSSESRVEKIIQAD